MHLTKLRNLLIFPISLSLSLSLSRFCLLSSKPNKQTNKTTAFSFFAESLSYLCSMIYILVVIIYMRFFLKQPKPTTTTKRYNFCLDFSFRFIF